MFNDWIDNYNDTNEIIENLTSVISKYKNLIATNDWQTIFDNCPAIGDMGDYQSTTYLYEFLKSLAFDPLKYMTTIPTGMFTYSALDVLLIPRNIKTIEANAFNESAIDHIYIFGNPKINEDTFADTTAVIHVHSDAFELIEFFEDNLIPYSTEI